MSPRVRGNWDPQWPCQCPLLRSTRLAKMPSSCHAFLPKRWARRNLSLHSPTTAHTASPAPMQATALTFTTAGVHAYINSAQVAFTNAGVHPCIQQRLRSTRAASYRKHSIPATPPDGGKVFSAGPPDESLPRRVALMQTTRAHTRTIPGQSD